MCGIAGILHLKDNGIDETSDILNKMLSVIKYRGPDGIGLYQKKRIGLGHLRLSIIDLTGGRQPMSNEDGSVWITFNGEIFNYLELRQDLIKKGHRFSNESDTEVIIHLYEDYGTECLKYLNGQFAFAIWDEKTQELFLARDRMGIIPLFYSMTHNNFYFASEIKAIFAAGEIPREIDPVALDQVFTIWCTVPPRTAFKDVYELPPGHYMRIRNGNIQVQQYWDIVFSGYLTEETFEDTIEGLKELLIDATRLRLRSDVPVGAYLSGGIDSSVITTLIRYLNNSSLHTFSVAFEDKDYDESIYQEKIVRALGTEHHEVKCSYYDISRNFSKVIWHTEKPILRTAPTPLFLLSKLVRENNIKVVLTGEGADEILGGYDIFKETKIREFCARFPDSRYRPLLLKRLYPYLPAFQEQAKVYREAFFNKGLSDTSDVLFSHRPRWMTTSKTKVFFSKELRQRINGPTPEESLTMLLSESVHELPLLARAQYIEIRNLLPGYILSSQGDRVSMGNSIEGRYPFLDHRVVEFCARLPNNFKIRVLNEKYILKECMKSYLPKEIVKRPKQPYLAPDSKSFFHNVKADDYMEELMTEECIGKYGYFNPKPVSFLINKCKRGRVIGFKDNMALVGILSTQLLHRLFIENFAT